jgi:EmrB/QacA subfamily drug resistance transporter
MSWRERLVPLVVATPAFMQNIDTSAMAIALPSIARSLDAPALHLNLVITSYLLSLAVFLPLSAWLADRIGARRLFCAAIVVFAAASALCGVAGSLSQLVSFRILQGMGAAMMVPVSRLLLLRSVPQAQLVAAMVWFTIPPTIGRLAGPLVGGAIVSFSSWHWLFFVNVPVGLLVVAVTLWVVEDFKPAVTPTDFDLRGFLFMAVGLAAMLGALQVYDKGIAPAWLSIAALGVGAAALWLYGRHSLRHDAPVIDLRVLAMPTFRANVVGAMPLRLALFAVPFLLPLMLQLGFGLSPLSAGLLTAASAFGALCSRVAVRWSLDRLGLPRLLIVATALTSALTASYSLFSPHTSHALIFALLFVGGLIGSLCMVSLNALALSNLPGHHQSHATAILAMAQQVAAGIGVVLASSLVAAFSFLRGRGGHDLLWQDFAAAFLMMGIIVLLSIPPFVRLSRNN